MLNDWIFLIEIVEKNVSHCVCDRKNQEKKIDDVCEYIEIEQFNFIACTIINECFVFQLKYYICNFFDFCDETIDVINEFVSHQKISIVDI